MPYVEVTEKIAAPAKKVYEKVKDMESYPEFMENVISVEVVERGENYTVTEWVVSLKGTKLKWQEKDTFDDENLHISYQQTEGDVKKFEGEWKINYDGQETTVTLTVDFEIGIPMFAGLLDPVAKLAVKKNSESMLLGIKANLEN